MSKAEYMRKWRAANPGRVKIYLERQAQVKRERYHSDPAFRQRRIATAARWQKENREHASAYQREWQRKRRAEARA